MPRTEALADFPQLYTGGRKETARQSITAEHCYPSLPELAARFSRSKIPASSAAIEACPWRKSRQVACLLFYDRV